MDTVQDVRLTDYVRLIGYALSRGWRMHPVDRAALSQIIFGGPDPDDRQWLTDQASMALVYLNSLAPDGCRYVLSADGRTIDLVQDKIMERPMIMGGASYRQRVYRHRDLDGDCTIIGCEVCL